MKPTTLRAISFGSFTKLCSLIFAAGGLSMGCCCFLLSVLGVNVYVYFGHFAVYGIVAGVLALLVFPWLWALAGALFSCAGFFFFKLFLWATAGISLKVETMEPMLSALPKIDSVPVS